MLDSLLEGVMSDITESLRRQMVAEINANPNTRISLEQKYGQVWDTSELTTDYDVQGFMAPYVVVRRKSDSVRGTLLFQHSPRFYYSFTKE